MDRYSIYCTPYQTKKALELGAPIDETAVTPPTVFIGEKIYSVPTAEQMIGWLEEQYLYITIRYTNNIAKHWQADIDHACRIDQKCGQNLVDFNFASRKTATLAAIDAALEYLENLK